MVLKGQTISNNVAEILLERITTGIYKIGERLPAERDLAESFGVSRPVIREALNRLQSMGLIVAARGTEGGSFVQELDSAFLASSISLMLKMKGVTREELVEARMILAPPIAAFAALRATDEDIHALEEIVSRIDGDRYSDQLHQSLVAFHLRLAAACRNPILQAAMMPLLHLIEPIADLAEIAARDRGLPPKQRHLAPIMNALKSRDPDKARLSMVEYMESFGQRLQSLEIQAPWVGSTPQPGPSK